MKPVYIKELHKYTVEDFKGRLNGSDKVREQEINLLLSHNMLKRAGNSNTSEAEPDELDEPVHGNEKFLAMKYVGIIITKHNIICSYPKYISRETDNLKDHFLKVMEVIRRLNRRELKLTLAQDAADTGSITMLAIILEIVHQYMANGLYIKHEQIQELNGDGEINWERTINETEAVLVRKYPFYPDMYTENSQWDENDYFHRLHKCIVAECYSYLSSSELNRMLNIHGGMRCAEKLKDFGSTKAIIQRLRKELNNQYVTWKKIAIRLMIAYLNRAGEKQEHRSVVYYGTNAMNITWEKACAKVLKNQMDKTLNDIDELNGIRKEIKNKYTKQLGKLIEHPTWIMVGSIKPDYTADTLKPDTVLIRKNCKGNLQLVIYDAKYYNIRLVNNKINGQPGIESITKQYIYLLAYKQLMNDIGIEDMENVFLFPTDGLSGYVGHVTLPMLGEIDIKNNVKLNNIKAVKINADVIWDLFLQGKQKELHELV